MVLSLVRQIFTIKYGCQPAESSRKGYTRIHHYTTESYYYYQYNPLNSTPKPPKRKPTPENRVHRPQIPRSAQPHETRGPSAQQSNRSRRDLPPPATRRFSRGARPPTKKASNTRRAKKPPSERDGRPSLGSARVRPCRLMIVPLMMRCGRVRTCRPGHHVTPVARAVAFCRRGSHLRLFFRDARLVTAIAGRSAGAASRREAAVLKRRRHYANWVGRLCWLRQSGLRVVLLWIYAGFSAVGVQ